MKFLSSFLLGAAWLCAGGCALAAPHATSPDIATNATATNATAKGAKTSVVTNSALADFPVSKAPYLAAYHWGAANVTGGARANEAYSRWINRPAVWAEDFEPTDAWENNIEGGGWQLGEWRDWKKVDPTNRRLILSVPLLPGGWDRSGAKNGAQAGQPVSLEAGAKGDYNAHFEALARNLVDYGLGDSVLRLGWEFNGGWYTFRASDNPQAWAGYWRQIVTTMRGVKGAEKLQFCWNPALGWQQFPAEQAYPGDEYVDIVGLDVYDESWGQDTYPLPDGASADEIEKRRDKAWNEVIYGGNMGLKWWSDFARAHGKLFALPEWSISKREDGHGGLDNPVFIERMHDFIDDPANNVYFSCHFDVQAGDGHHQLSTGPGEDETNEFSPLGGALSRIIRANRCRNSRKWNRFDGDFFCRQSPGESSSHGDGADARFRWESAIADCGSRQNDAGRALRRAGSGVGRRGLYISHRFRWASAFVGERYAGFRWRQSNAERHHRARRGPEI